MDMRKALQMQYGIAPDDQPQPGMSQWDAMIHALGQDATKIGTGIKKGVTKLGEEMKYPHGTDPKNYTATMGAALNTLGLGYGPAVGRMAMGNLRPNPAQMNMNVWQGGPNKYGPEGAAKSLDHIGKGEGAHSYGWGRYDAESKAVAQDYAGMSKTHKVSPDSAHIAAAKDFIKHDMNPHDGLKTAYPGITDDAIEAAVIEAKGGFSPNIYKHDLPDADVERYLDWDKPLSEQPKAIRAIIDKLNKDVVDPGFNDTMGNLLADLQKQTGKETTGRDFYEALSRYGKQTSQQTSEQLGKAGIPGLKYYDGMSRPVQTAKKYSNTIREKAAVLRKSGDTKEALALERQADGMDENLAKETQTRNFVTWDQDVLNRMKLLERNGEMADALK